MKGTWTTVEIAGKTADVYEPPGFGRPHFGMLYLHGPEPDTLVNRPAFTRFFDEFQTPCVCPHGGQSWWTDRICPEFDARVSAEHHVLHAVLPYFQDRWGLAPRALGLLGAGMGGQGALRFAFKYSDRFPVVAALAPAIEYHELYGQGTPLDDMYDSKEQCRQDTAPLHVPPHHYPPYIFFCCDPNEVTWFRGNDRLHEKLNALGIPHECDLTTEVGGNFWDYRNHMAERALRFLRAGLEQESRRLI